MNDQPNDALSRTDGRCARGFAILALAVATSVGCTDVRQHQGETSPYLQKGSASISGVVTIDTGQAQITAPPKTPVYLTPATTLANQRLQDEVIAKNELPEERESQLVLLSQTDSQGRFRFVGLAPGDYILASRVVWKPAGSTATRTDVAYARVALATGESASVSVTRVIGGR